MNLQSKARGDKTEHRWRMMTHLDGCHFYASIYVCMDCGASYSIELERSMDDDPYSAVWYDERDADDPEACARCIELRNGAEAKPPREAFQPA